MTQTGSKRPYRSCRICILEDLEFANFVYCFSRTKNIKLKKTNQKIQVIIRNPNVCFVSFSTEEVIPASVPPCKRTVLHVRIVEANHCVVLTRDATCAIAIKVICQKSVKNHADFVKYNLPCSLCESCKSCHSQVSYEPSQTVLG